MKPDENEVKTKNAELHLATLREDSNKEASLLTELLEGKEQLLKDVAEVHAEIEKETLAISGERVALASERTDNLRIKQDSEKSVLRAKEELEVVHSQRNKAMKELSDLNDWGFKAEQAKKDLEVSITELTEKEKHKKTLLEDLESLEKEKEDAEIILGQVKLETGLLVDETTAKVKSLEKEADEAVKVKTEALEGKEQAEIALYDLHNEMIKKKADLDICIDRVEKKFGEAFPELRMKI